MTESWAVTARRRLAFYPRVLCTFPDEASARREHDRLVRAEPEWRFGLMGFGEGPIHDDEEALRPTLRPPRPRNPRRKPAAKPRR